MYQNLNETIALKIDAEIQLEELERETDQRYEKFKIMKGVGETRVQVIERLKNAIRIREVRLEVIKEMTEEENKKTLKDNSNKNVKTTQETNSENN